MLTRIDKIRSLFDTNGFGLEIGPSFSPLVPKSEGFNVEILDHLSKDQLVRKYTDAPNVDLNKIEHVDYISDGGSIFKSIGIQNRYDFIVASHVVEHTVDLIQFINDCCRLLKDDGVLVLAVPDKRFAFDSVRPVTTTGQILQANYEGRVTHTPGQIFDEIAYNITRGGQIGWVDGSRKNLEFFMTLDKALEVFNKQKQANEFIDIHGWQFSPASFRLIMLDLYLMGFVKIKESQFVDTIGHEFYICFTRNSSSTLPSRESLAEMILDENNIFSVSP
jgi:predicted SAM-dependent methyltransferase